MFALVGSAVDQNSAAAMNNTTMMPLANITSQ